MTKNKKNKNGFTLPEILVSISVLIMVVYSATGLLVSAIRINGENVNTIIAHGLAQEGLEAFRNIRDSNWLLGLDYKKGGEISTDGKQVKLWGEKLPTDVNSPAYYLLDYQNVGETFFYLKQDYKIDASNAPWKLEVLNLSGLQKPDDELLAADRTLLYKSADNGRDVIYSPAQLLDASATAYHRFLKVELLDHNDHLQKKKYRVSCFVSWPASNGMHKVVLTTELTDWKEGII